MGHDKKLTATELKDNFETAYSKNGDGGGQCSFSVKDATQFYAAILASSYNEQINKDISWNELLLKPYYSQDDIPQIDAFWFKSGNDDAKKKS